MFGSLQLDAAGAVVAVCAHDFDGEGAYPEVCASENARDHASVAERRSCRDLAPQDQRSPPVFFLSLSLFRDSHFSFSLQRPELPAWRASFARVCLCDATLSERAA